MAFQDFELIEGKEFYRRCKTCGAEVPTGIISLSEHWVNCTGKDFHTSLMNNPKGGNISIEEVNELIDKHLK